MPRKAKPGRGWRGVTQPPGVSLSAPSALRHQQRPCPGWGRCEADVKGWAEPPGPVENEPLSSQWDKVGTNSCLTLGEEWASHHGHNSSTLLLQRLHSDRKLRRRVIVWLQAFPQGWCSSTHWCDAFFPASSLLGPAPGAYLQSGSYSLPPLSNWNKFTQLQLEGLQTIHFLFLCFGKKPFPWGPRLPLISVIRLQFWVTAFPACFYWNAAIFHLKVYFNIKSQIWLNLNQKKGLGRQRNNNTSI